MEIADHVERDHWTEVPGEWSVKELKAFHKALHQRRDDWGHSYNSEG